MSAHRRFLRWNDRNISLGRYLLLRSTVVLLQRMLVKIGGGERVNNVYLLRISNLNCSGRKKPGVQRIELIWIRISPDRKTLNSPDHFECTRKRVHHVIAAKAIPRAL